MRSAVLRLTSAAVFVLATACSRADSSVPRADSVARATPTATSPSAAPAAHRPGDVIDSILPVEEELRRFRVGLGPSPRELADGAPSRSALVDRFADAISRGDTAALLRLAMTRAEFAYLVYPSSPYTHSPYRQSPALVWYQLQAAGAKAATRLVRRLGGRPLRLAGHACAKTPEVEGENRLWRECVAHVVQPDGTVRDERLFGVIVERHGRFKFASFANRM